MTKAPSKVAVQSTDGGVGSSSKSFKVEGSKSFKSFKSFKSSKSSKSFQGSHGTGDGYSFNKEFEAWGSYSGPPGQPEASEVSATSLLLHWSPPQHLGGSGFEVTGYQVLVQCGGEGGFVVYTADTGSDMTQCLVEELVPDTWHEFQTCAITAAGIGAPSAASAPVLTDRAPPLLRELRAAETLTLKLKERLARYQEELLHRARSGTMALRLDSSEGARSAGGGDEASFGADDQLTVADAQRAMRRRKRLEKEVVQLEERLADHEARVLVLRTSKESSDAARREALAQAVGFVGAYGSGELGAAGDGGGDGGNVWGAIFNLSASGTASPSTTSAPYGSTSRTLAGVGRGIHGAVSIQAAGRRQRADVRRLQMLEAYARLFAEEDTASEAFAPFNREAVRKQLHRALSQHALANGGHELRHYFDLALNRARSADAHNVFDRFEDWELEQAALLFGRFDSSHDGVLEFGDFCRVMLLVAGRVGATYHRPQLVAMFDKADLNGDRLIDLNEFLWMQTPTPAAAAARSQERESAGTAAGGDGPLRHGVHQRPQRDGRYSAAAGEDGRRESRSRSTSWIQGGDAGDDGEEEGEVELEDAMELRAMLDDDAGHSFNI